MYVLERIPGITIVVATVVRSFAAQPVDRPVSLGAKSMRASILSLFNASTAGAILARFFRPESPGIQGELARHPCLYRPSEWSFWNPGGIVRRD
jgi:hypothetical protein